MELPVLCLECEGILIETVEARREAMAAALRAEGLTLSEGVWSEVLHEAVEVGITHARRRLGAPEDPTAVELARLRAEQGFADRIARGLTLVPDAVATLERLSAHARLVLVTRATRREVDLLLDRGGLPALFRPIVALDEVRPSKPAPAAWAHALAQVQTLFPAQQLRPIAVEDHLAGIRGARAAGCMTIMIGAVPAHEAIEADAWVETLADLTPERLRALGDSPSVDPR